MSNVNYIQQAKQNISVLDYCNSYLPGGKIKNNEYVVLNPTRNDRNPGSFRIDLETGAFFDFADPDKTRGGDIVALHAFLNNKTQTEAAMDLLEQPKEDIKYITPIPKDIEPPKLQKGFTRYPYYNANLELMFVVDIKGTGQDKVVIPRSYAIDNKWVDKLACNHIFNVKALIDKPSAEVLIVEGEKACLAAERIFPQYAVITWAGGANKCCHPDYSLLKGRKAWLWPDNDTGGHTAMSKLQKKLKSICKATTIIDVKSLNKREKWDLANAEEGEDFCHLFVEELQKPEKIPMSSFPLLTSKNKIINSYENVEYMFQQYEITAKFNEIRKDIEIYIPGKSFSKANKALLELAEITSLCIKNDIPRCDIAEWILMIADNHSYNPVEDFILSKPWDGISRIESFIETLSCANNKIRDILVRRWMIGAVAVGFSKNGLAHPGVLTLNGEQYIGKSAWFKSLVPHDLNLTMGDFSLRPDDKDKVIEATQYWITELSEVDGAIRKSDVAAMKAFITRSTDVYRRPYDKASMEAPRKTAFMATVNDEMFLRDATGNRRWWVLKVLKADYDHKLDMQQVWAEFHQLYLKGEQYHLTHEEFDMLNESNDEFTVKTSLEELVMDRYNWHLPDRNLRRSATEVLYECDFDITTSTNTKQVVAILQKLGCEQKFVNGRKKYCLPELNHQFKKLY